MIRVNRLTVYVDTNRGEPSFITLYRTNTRLAEISNRDIKIPDFSESDVDKDTYRSYCRDVVTNLLENGGIEDFYWEPKHTDTEDTGVVRKFSPNTFRQAAISKVKEILDQMLVDTGITYTINEYKDSDVDVKERYKDLNVKFGSTNIVIDLKMSDKPIQIVVMVELRSGQMCKPKTFTMNDGSSKQLNITTITKLYK